MNTIKKFFISILVIAGLGILFFGAYLVKSSANLKHDPRNNSDCKTNERVFDFADKMTDEEEDTLRSDISEIENKFGMDFVVVTMDQNTDLSEYGASAVSYDIEFNTKDIAERMCDFYRFGWEEWPEGTYLDGRDASTSVVIVANWQEGDGYVYLCTSGKARKRISDSGAQSITEYGGELLRSDTLGAFERMIDKTDSAMKSSSGGIKIFSPFVWGVISVVIGIIFVLVNYARRKGTDTTTASTYSKGDAQIIDRRDIFIRKQVTKTKIERSSGGGSSGGGGGHGGGGSHF